MKMGLEDLPMKRAFGYLRVSGNNQLDGDGFPRQRAAIEAWAEKNGYTIVEWFEERAVTGTLDGLERPAWSEMIERCAPDTVVVLEALHRLARDLMIQEAALKDARIREVQIFSTDPTEADLCSQDPTRKLIRQIMGAFAEYDRAQIVAKLKGARERARLKNGKCEGQKAYGQDPNRPDEALILKRMLSLRDQGFSFQEIADDLNSHTSMLARKNHRWKRQTIAKIIGREAPRPESVALAQASPLEPLPEVAEA